MKFLVQLILLIAFCCPLHAQIDRYKKNLLTTNDLVLGPSITLSNGILDAATSSSASLQSLYYGGQYGFGASSIIPTNIRSGNLSVGTNDIFTVPAGKRFLKQYFHAGSTNPAVTAFLLLKTNGVYYRYNNNVTVTTNFPAGMMVAGDNFLFEAGESIAISTDKDGVNISMNGLLFPTNNASLYSPRLFSLTTGTNTIYTCPVGKCAIQMTFPNELTAGEGALFVEHINDSGASISSSFFEVRSGELPSSTNKMFTATVTDKSRNLFIGHILFPGDYFALSVSTNIGQWVRLTVAEIPFP